MNRCSLQTSIYTRVFDILQQHQQHTLMGCFRWFFLSATILTKLTFLVTAQTHLNSLYHVCGTTGNYTNSSSSSSYANNLNQLLSSLSANVTTSSNGFNNMTTGQSPDTVYGAFLCRGDVSIQFCQTCVDAARTDIAQSCPNQKESIIWFDQCMLRYSNRSFFSVMQTYPGYYMWNMVNTTDPEGFNRILGDLMNGLVTEAVEGSSSSRALFGTKEVAFNSSQRIYGLVQCTPDLIRDDCGVCLREAISRIPTCCDRKQGGRVIFPSCNLRYEIYPFFESRPTASPSPSPLVSLPPTPLMPPPLTNSTTPEGKGKISSRIVVVVVIPSAFALILLCAITFCLCRRKRRTKQRSTGKVEDVEDISTVESLQFNFETVKAATDDFSDANKLGEGGFGAVYQGQLPDGQKIAVKRLSRNSRQGDEEFKNEVVLVAKLQHRNLVRLLGFCFEGEEKLLIYEFVPNTSLDHFIFDPVKRADLNWEIRYRIIGGIAQGMLYLHEDSRLRIIHRDLKASNILLDAGMNPKISDFGMARLFVVDQTQGNTSTIMGTYGYMAPEYLMHGHFSVKSDAFSFGVLLLEIVTGHRNNSFYQSEHGEDLLSYAWRHWKEGRTLQLIDPTLRSSYSAGKVVRCIHIGLLCVQEDAADRPTMGSVVVMLSSHSVSLALPAKPAFFVNSKMESLTSDVDESHSIEPERASVANLALLIEPERAAMANSELCSVNDVSITEIYPR